VPPEATETISYRMPAFKHKGVLVWFAAFSNHCSLFPTASVIEAFKDELNGQAGAGRTYQETCEGARRAERKQETTLTGLP
jgi:uncharacterized protein YdhG (YjbR/CyaY superfamily)